MGRPSKGTRIRVSTRLPLIVHAAATRAAAARGLDMSTWLAEAAQAHLHTHAPASAPPDKHNDTP